MKNFRILMADDDRNLLNTTSGKLKAAGYEVITAFDGLEALEQAQTQEPDLVIIDILMPRMDGFTLLQELRKFSKVPVIILSSQNTDIARIKGLNLGADDYLMKPFNFEELSARITVVRRRTQSPGGNENEHLLRSGDITIDFNKQSVKLKDETVPLTLIEWQLLKELALNSGRLIQYEQLLNKVWGPDYSDDVQLLRTWISRLRNKIENSSGIPLIQTVRKTGYIIKLPPADSTNK